ncbi:hypothetical protein V501_05572 [Pseudogymnoascus sp. VKM F-4519 (FW-2642)]|nr:hypothetical protein V501_05572 [Pseudogymnoascus sp. VKM F-4519 (FW-2642)]
MVYCGKPSGACHACRERRTRCDKLPDGCTQCTNAKRMCPGYRAMGDVLFKDVTTNVIRKAKAGEVRAKQAALRSSPQSSTPQTPSATADDDSDPSEDGMEVVAQATPLQHFSLVPSVDERATGLFVANYVYALDGHTRGHLDYLTDVFRKDSLDEGLLSSMKAVGLAGFAHTTRSPYLIKNARYQYIKAIQHTNAALRDPSTAKKDATLLTIIILGIFESVTGGSLRSLRDWVAHVMGACDVVKVRGHKGIESISGRRMLLQVTSNLLISCVQKGDPVPDDIAELIFAAINTVRTKDLLNNIQSNESAFLVLECMIKFAKLRSDVVHCHETDPLVIYVRCIELDSILENLSNNPPEHWRIHTVFTDAAPDFIYNGRYHINTDYIVSQSWNALRIVRFMLNEIVRDLLTPGATVRDVPTSGATESMPLHSPLTGPEFEAQRLKSIAAMYEAQEGILYSVPQHTDAIPDQGGSGSSANSSVRTVWSDFRDSPGEEKPLAKISGALFLIWPLWFVGINDTASDEIRRFVVRNLRMVGDRMGIKQAYLLADAVESHIELSVSL